MKQFNFEITNIKKISSCLNEVQTQISGTSYSAVLFHIFSMSYEDEILLEVQKNILAVFPDALITGTSTNGDICDGHLADDGLVLAVSVFESTTIETHLIACEKDCEEEVGLKIKDIINTTPNIKAAEIFITLKTINSHTVLNIAETCNEDVIIFGGGSADSEISSTNTKVISNGTVCHDGVALVTFSGDDLNIDVHHAIPRHYTFKQSGRNSCG